MSGPSAESSIGSAAGAPVTVVTQTRVVTGGEAAFAAWQEGTGRVLSGFPGFVGQKVIPPAPPAQVDWVILQQFASSEAAVGWLNARERLDRVATVQPLLVGRDDVHIVTDSTGGVRPAPVSAVISTRIKPGREGDYKAWEQRIAAAQSLAPGFEGYRFEAPIPGVQEDWLAILRFDTEEHLQGWLASPRRLALLEEARDFTDEFHARIVRTGFDQWFQGRDPAAASPPGWKQNMLVLLMLYPVVFLFGLLVQTPLLMRWADLHFAVALFIGNVVSVVLLSRLVPWTNRLFDWWLRPPPAGGRRTEVVGVALLAALYGLSIFAFTRMDGVARFLAP